MVARVATVGATEADNVGTGTSGVTSSLVGSAGPIAVLATAESMRTASSDGAIADSGDNGCHR